MRRILRFFGDTSSNRLIFFILALIAITFTILTLLSKGVYGGADNAAHYKLARYAFQKPEFFFNYWAKPGYTILVAPVAQFGFEAVRLLNVFLGILTSYFIFLIAKRLNYNNVYLIPFLICFAPGYVTAMMSTNTETIFIFFTILSVYLFIRENYAASLIIISFTPLIRPEAIFFMGFLGLAVLIKRKFKYIPLFFIGIFLFLIAGYFFFNGLSWLQNFIPYGPINSYGGGTGDFLHYARQSKSIFGLPHTYLLVIGTVIVIYFLFKKNIWKDKELLIHKYLLVVFPFLGFYLIQSIAAWKGIATSYGPIRHMVPAIPFGAIVVLDGFDAIQRLIRKVPYLFTIISLIFIFFLIRTTFEIVNLPIPYTPEQEAVHKTTKWLKKTGYYDNKLYFYNSFFSAFNYDLNPYNYNRACFVLGINNHSTIPKNSIILWDPHFGPHHGDSYDEFKDKYYELIKIIEPSYKFTKNGMEYGIYIFKKEIKSDDSNQNKHVNHCE